VSADTEILETAQELQQFTQRPTLIVTADYGMQLRAAANGLLIAEVPTDYRL
jgi:predicted ribonuclease YlaK